MTLSSSLVDVKGPAHGDPDGRRRRTARRSARWGDHRGIRLLRAVGGAVLGDRAAGSGYGASELDPPVNGRDEAAAHVRDVLDALGIERTALVGHSLGGWLAAAVAAHFPDRVGALCWGHRTAWTSRSTVAPT